LFGFAIIGAAVEAARPFAQAPFGLDALPFAAAPVGGGVLTAKGFPAVGLLSARAAGPVQNAATPRIQVRQNNLNILLSFIVDL
jgi:hypothetical protein